MYELNDLGRASTPLPGVPWRDMPDSEFEAVSGAYDAQFSPDQAGSLGRFFTHVPDTRASEVERPRRERAPKEA